MADIFVSQAGGGAGTGPTDTISMASFNTTASGGNTYYFIGTITTSINCLQGSLGNYVTIRGDYPGYPGNVTVATGYGMQCTGGARSYYIVKNITITATTGTAVFTNGDFYTFDGCTLNGNLGIVLSPTRTAKNITITNCTFNTTTSDCIQWAASAAYIISNITIQNNIINASPRYGIYLSNTGTVAGCTDYNITDNIITGSVNAGIRINDDATTGIVSNVSIQNNTITGNVGGLALYNIAGNIINNNISSNTGVTSGLNIFDSTGVVIENNIASYNTTTGLDGCGILIDNGNDDITVRYNECSHNLGSATDNSGVGIMVLGSTNLNIYGNKGTGNRHGFWFAGSVGVLQNCVVNNNVFTNCTDDGANIHANVAISELTFVNNILTGSTGYAVDDADSGNAQIHSNNILYGWSTPYKNMGKDGTELTTDPQLDSNHIPAISSPCYHAGTTVNFNMKDFKGHKFNNPPTIGAYEFTSRSQAKSGRNW